jgi:pre-mRNA 3'-end-processing factor FIP1
MHSRQSRYSDIRNIPQRSTSHDVAVKPAAVKQEDSATKTSMPLGVPSADQAAAAASNSTIDLNSNPVYPAAGKPITQVNIDEGELHIPLESSCSWLKRETDLPENDKPWRKPGTDISDYFNYGFDEFTWALYAAKQESMRGEFNSDAFSAGNKKFMDEMANMANMMMGGMGMPGAAAGAGTGAMQSMPGMEGMPPEMQQMMQQMMASGMDPNMDPSAMAAMFAGMQNPANNAAAQAGQTQNFGQGFGGNQGQYGYDQQAMGGGRGGFGGGRGRGGRRNW